MADQQSVSGLLVAGKGTALPLKDISVEAEVKGYVLGLQSTLKYCNDSPDPVEVLFRFPVEQSHAVVGLTAVIDGRRIRAEVREKEEARAAYDDAIASGRSAAFAEEKSGDVFSISLGNLPPQKEAEIQLQLVGELPIDAEGGVRFSLPTTLKPRYTPAGSSDPLAPVPSGDSDQVEQASVAGAHSFQMKVLDAEDVAEVTSPTHAIAVAKEGEGLRVSLSEQKPSSKDLVILIRHKAPHTLKAVVESGITTSRENAFMSSPAVMVNFFPEFPNEEAACEFIFLVDRSGSMNGGFIRSARETLTLFLKSIPEGSYINIIGFGSRYEKLFDQSVPYSQATLDKATSHSQTMKADLGGTELLPPLKYIFGLKTLAGFPRQIFVLTDGSVSNTSACIEAVRKNAHSARCFTFGIGSGASTALVEGLARAGSGTAEFVKEGERLQPKVVRSLKRALQPAVTDVSVSFEVHKKFEVLQSPPTLPPVFNGEKMVVYAVLKPTTATPAGKVSGKAILQGKMLGKKLKTAVPFQILPSSPEAHTLPTVHHLAAKALIKDWQTMGGRDSKEIVQLSVESSVISSRTAFIAVDEESSEPVAGAMKTWDVKARFSAQFSNYSSLDSDDDSDSEFDNLFSHSHVLRSCVSIPVPRVRGYCVRCAPFDEDDLKEELEEGGAFFAETNKSTPPAPAALSPVKHSKPRVFMKGEFQEPRMVLKGENARVVSKPTAPATGLASFIDLQQANGSWETSSALTERLLGHSNPAALLEACPVKCEGPLSAVWATVLVLTRLRLGYSDQQEEWELIAVKAESWLRRQQLPAGTTLEELYQAAEKLLA